MTTVQLVEDNDVLRRQIADELRVLGYDVQTSGDGRAAIAALLQTPPDLVLLDLGLPDVDGSTLLSVIRATAHDLPVVVVTARSDSSEMVRLLDLGADDYVTKPFEIVALDARIRAVLRRTGPHDGRGPIKATIDVGDLHVDTRLRHVSIAGRAIVLRPLEYELLLMLALADGQLLPTDLITSSIWGTTGSEAAARLDVHLSTLRTKLGETAREPRYIHRVRGVGVRILEPAA